MEAAARGKANSGVGARRTSCCHARSPASRLLLCTAASYGGISLPTSMAYAGSECHPSCCGRLSRCNPDDSASRVSGGASEHQEVLSSLPCSSVGRRLQSQPMVVSSTSGDILRCTITFSLCLSSPFPPFPFLLGSLQPVGPHDVTVTLFSTGVGHQLLVALLSSIPPSPSRFPLASHRRGHKNILINKLVSTTGSWSYSPIIYFGLKFSWWILDYM